MREVPEGEVHHLLHVRLSLLDLQVHKRSLLIFKHVCISQQNMMTRAGVWKSAHMLPTLALLPGEPEVPLCCRVGGNYCLTDFYKLKPSIWTLLWISSKTNLIVHRSGSCFSWCSSNQDTSDDPVWQIRYHHLVLKPLSSGICQVMNHTSRF